MLGVKGETVKKGRVLSKEEYVFVAFLLMIVDICILN